MPDFVSAANAPGANRPQPGSQSNSFKERLKERCAAFLDVLVSTKMSIKRKLYWGLKEPEGSAVSEAGL
jgi:hypothetical protein